MSYETRSNGFTAWVNVRLFELNCQVDNILTDLFMGSNMMLLLESLTGRKLTQISSLEGLTKFQTLQRVEWFVEEIRNHDIIAKHVRIDCRSIAMKKPSKVLDLLWKLITYDIWFTWERFGQLQHADDSVVCSVPFQWTPRVPTAESPQLVTGATLSLLANLEILSRKSHSSIRSLQTSLAGKMDFEPYPGREQAKTYNRKIPKKGWDHYPPPKKCIIEQINGLLKMTSTGQKQQIVHLEDFRNSHVMCSLVNALIPGTFTIEVILNDRWATNLALGTLETLLYITTPFTVNDFHEVNHQAICAYMCFICMAGYKYRQSKAVVNCVKKLNLQIDLITSRLEELVSEILELEEAKEKQDLQQKKRKLEQDLMQLKSNYDVKFCEGWVKHALTVQQKTKRIVLEKKRDRFETVFVPRNITIGEFCVWMGINLLLTGGSGFYQTDAKEPLTPNRRIVLERKETGEFFEDFSGSQSNETVRTLLNLTSDEIVEVSSRTFKDFQLFFESKSKNKILKANSFFLYQVFPGSNASWHQQLLRAVKGRVYTTVENLILFFKDAFPEAINLGEPSTGNSALHFACQIGCLELALLLLEHGASPDGKNEGGRTPLHIAALGLHRQVCQLLIEWGCDLHIKDNRKHTALDVIRNEEIKYYLVGHSALCSSLVESVMDDSPDVLQKIIHVHTHRLNVMASLRSRCIDGSTLLHTAVYFGERTLVKALLDLQVDVNLLDYKEATPLQRCNDKNIMQLLLSRGADIDWADADGNTALHMISYGERGKSDQLACLELLLSCKASRGKQNKKGMLPIHCAAMQGRMSALQLLLDGDEEVKTNIEESFVERHAPSPLYLALAHSHMKCVKWLASNMFTFNSGEAEELMFSILNNEIKVKDQIQTLDFLAKKDLKVNALRKNGNSALHFAAFRNDTYELLAMLLDYGADVDIMDREKCTPLFYAVFASNFHAASLLIDHGANVHHQDKKGFTAFDYISDFHEWLQCGLFSDCILELLEVYDVKQSYSLITRVTDKLDKMGEDASSKSHSDWSAFRSKSQPHIGYSG